jgi:hypothetical protein
MASSVPSCDALPETPVFGATQFTGRTRIAQNLLRRCLRRQSILLYGGPKLGKTSMLLHLKWLLDQDREPSSATPGALYLDLSDEVARKQLLLGRPVTPAPILLLDDCDNLLEENYLDRLREFMTSASHAHAIVWAGARLWHDFVLNHRWTADLRPAPLAVLLQGEARDLVTPRLTPNQITAALAVGGTHPYVLNVVVQHMLSRPGNPTRATLAAREHLVPFFQTCHEAVRQADEQALLKYLVQEARPINPQEAAMALGVSSIKPAADALCWIGLISRWNLDEGAMLQANCRIFNEWYLATVR